MCVIVQHGERVLTGVAEAERWLLCPGLPFLFPTLSLFLSRSCAGEQTAFAGRSLYEPGADSEAKPVVELR